MLTVDEINEIILIIDTHEACIIKIKSRYLAVPDVVVSKFKGDSFEFLKGGISSSFDRSDLKKKLNGLAYGYHSYIIVNKSAYGLSGWAYDSSNICQHQYVDVGFRFERMVCKICNAEKGEV